VTLSRKTSRSRKTPRLPKADSDDLKALEDLCSWERVRARLTLGPSCREDAVKIDAGSQTEAAQDGLGGPVRIGAILRNPWKTLQCKMESPGAPQKCKVHNCVLGWDGGHFWTSVHPTFKDATKDMHDHIQVHKVALSKGRGNLGIPWHSYVEEKLWI
jgi:hypothetical protein